MDIVLVGAGNVANQIAKTFQKKNISIKQIYSRTLESAQKLAKEINVSFTNNLAEIDRQADVYFYA
ncbi:MAG TPA: NAD(P)-binding domain-containing protein, partial [Paludibacteraceae bacterium]|nr:NAD(P)-binding domain-containing protein [Paludibacteraceae bacterium]